MPTKAKSAASLDLDSPDEAPEITVKIGGVTITIDLVQAHGACVMGPVISKKGKSVEEILPDVRAYLESQIASQLSGDTSVTVSDTQACRFYWYLVEKMAEFEKKVLPASMQKPALPSFTE